MLDEPGGPLKAANQAIVSFKTNQPSISVIFSNIALGESYSQPYFDPVWTFTSTPVSLVKALVSRSTVCSCCAA
jgi:hypothetical protein